MKFAMPVQQHQVAAAFDSGYLNLILLPTEQCNFRCTYCYEDFAVGVMSSAVVEGVKHLVARRASSLDTLDVSWFGGEPLVAKPVLLGLAEHFARLSSRHKFVYRATMTTNAYLLDLRTAARLVDLGLEMIQVSLDGPEEIHDHTRRKATGAGTFRRIWGNLLALRNSSLPLRVILRVHFSPSTWERLGSLITDINDSFGADARFEVFFHAVERLGGPQDDHIAPFSHHDKKRVEQALVAQLRGSTQAYSLGTARNPYICYAARPNSLVIRANGEIAKCTVALYDRRNRVGRLMPDGTVSIAQTRLRPWIRGFASLDENALACPLMNLPQDNERHGRLHARSVSYSTA